MTKQDKATAIRKLVAVQRAKRKSTGLRRKEQAKIRQAKTCH